MAKACGTPVTRRHQANHAEPMRHQTDNQIYSQGYYSEIEAFVTSVEKEKNRAVTELKAVKETYELLQELGGG